jgi:hypothetical protein
MIGSLTNSRRLGENAGMSDQQADRPSSTATPQADVPDRLCTWCKVPMKKRLVASGQFIHYTCPKCIFQHSTKVGAKPHAG